MNEERINRKAELLVAGSVLFATIGQVLIKLGLSGSAQPWIAVIGSLHSPFTLGVLCGLLVYGAGTLLWIAAVSQRNISYLYPLASLSYILIALCGHFVLKEPLLLGRWAGILIMTAGIVLLTRAAPKSGKALAA